MSALVLIVEDEPDLLETLQYNLQKEGYATRVAPDGASALNEAFREPFPDLVLLDLMLPDMSGNEVCRQLRANPATQAIPVSMVTARSEEVDRVVGFEVGADDYVVKPYSPRELLLRVRAILRRSVTPEAQQAEQLRFGALVVDELGHRVWVSEQEITLTALEFRLLTTLLSRKGRVQSRARLLDDVWGLDAVVTPRTVDTHVKRLREKLGDAGACIETIRGVGYRFLSEPKGAGEPR